MLGSTLIDAVNAAMEETRFHVEQEMNLSRMIACAEVRGIKRDDNNRMKCGFCYATTIATGEAESDEVYRRFLEDHLRSGHSSMLSQESIPETGWEGSPIVMKHIERNYDPDELKYSIAVAALGGTREENTTIVNAILHDIPEIG